jgi:hypothetical protein
MRRTASSLAVVFSLIILGLVGCDFSGIGGPVSLEEAVQAGVQATLTKEAWLVGVEDARLTAISYAKTCSGSSGISRGDQGTGGFIFNRS